MYKAGASQSEQEEFHLNVPVGSYKYDMIDSMIYYSTYCYYSFSIGEGDTMLID